MVLNTGPLGWESNALTARPLLHNSCTFIDVKGTAEKLNYIQALPGAYAFTGYDNTPPFFRKGKKRPIEIMLKSDLIINTFNKMGEDLIDEDIDALESFTCSMFGYSKLTSIYEARYIQLTSKCKPKEAAKPLGCLKNVDPCLFPPCKQVLMTQIKRSWYIAKLYKNAAVPDPLANYTLIDYGFELIDGYVHVKWFVGEQVPQGAEDDDDRAMEHSDNQYVEEEDEVTDDEVKMEIVVVVVVVVVVMMMMMIWMIRTDEHHAPSITMTSSRCHLICFVLKFVVLKCEQYFTFSLTILFFFKHFGRKFKALKHIKELRPANFKIKTSLGSICSVLDCSSLILQNFRPAKFFKFKFLPLVKDYPGEYYSLLSDIYAMLKPGIKVL